jgi:hypothetical protein
MTLRGFIEQLSAPTNNLDERGGVTAMLKAIHGQEDREELLKKARKVLAVFFKLDKVEDWKTKGNVPE